MLSLILGPVIGLLGSSVSRYFKFKEKEQDISLAKLNNAHELTLFDRQAQLRSEDNEHALDVLDAETQSAAVQATYAHDSAMGETYLWVEAVRKLTRPFLTLVSIIIATAVVFSVKDQLRGSDLLDLTLKVIGLAEATFIWWFASRNESK